MGNQASARSWHSTLETIKDSYIKAYTAIEKGISCEENEKPHEALKYYKLGIYYIDEALKIPVEYPEHVGDESFKEAVGMVQKMKGTRGEVLQRITQIIKSPAYEKEQVTPTDESPKGDSITYSDLAKALENMKSAMVEQNDSSVQEIFKCNDVKIFQIRADGSVISQSTAEELVIVKITDRRDHTYSLRIGDWVYPLIPGVSPCYRANFKAFIFPDLFSTVPGNAVGLVVPEEFDAQLLSLLEDILHGIVYQSPEHSLSSKKDEIGQIKPSTTAEAIVYGLTTGAQYLSWGLLKGAEKTGDLMNYVTPKIISKMNPGRHNEEPISEGVTTGINVAKNVTGAAVEVTGYVADKVTIATIALGRFLAPHIQKQGERVLKSGLNLSEEEAKHKMGGILTVAAGAVEGFATVYSGLEESAAILGENFKNNTVKVVEYKYGPNTGEAVSGTLTTFGNALTVTENVKGLKPKKLVKKTAKAAGKAVIEVGNEQLTEQQADEEMNVPEGMMYPDLSEMSRQLQISERQNMNQ